MQELSFKLSKPITVSKDGDLEEVYELVLKAPSMKDRKQASRIKQIVARSQTSFMKNFSDEQIKSIQEAAVNRPQDDSEDNGDSIKAIIVGSGEDLEGLYEAFDTLAFRVCEVLDGVNLKQSHLEQMELSDYEKLCFEYVENFIGV